MESVYTLLGIGVLASTFALVLLTFGDYGLAWDEPWYMRYGQAILSFFSSGGVDDAAMRPGWVPFGRGGTFSVLVEGLASISPLEPLDTRKLVTGLTGIVGLIGTWMTARAAFGAAAGFWAVFALALLPNYYGHMFINPIDLPFAVGYIWSLYFVVRILRAFPEVPYRHFFGLGIALGVAMGARFSGGVLLLGTFGLMWLLRTILEWRWDGITAVAPLAARTVMAGVATLVVALVVMSAFWPKILTDPFFLVRVVSIETGFPKLKYTTFMGRSAPSTGLPFYYWGLYLLIRTPLPTLFAAIGATTIAARQAKQKIQMREPWPLFGYATLTCAWLMPLAVATVMRPADYDGIRHFLFVLPPMACLAGALFAGLVSSAARFRKFAGPLVAVAIIASFLPTAHAMIRLHPYQYTYYNALIGGTKGAEDRFETEYWATSYREALNGLQAVIEEAHFMPPPGKSYFGIAVCGAHKVARYLIKPPLQFVDTFEEADFFLGTIKRQCHRTKPGPPLVLVARDGVTFAVVKQLRPVRIAPTGTAPSP